MVFTFVLILLLNSGNEPVQLVRVGLRVGLRLGVTGIKN